MGNWWTINFNQQLYKSSKIENCYNSGDIDSKGIVVGGIGNNDQYNIIKVIK